MTAAPATLTVTLAPTVDPEALAASIKAQVANALRALADELSPAAESGPVLERFYLATDSDSDYWILDRARPGYGECFYGGEAAARRYLTDVRSGERDAPDADAADLYGPYEEVTS